MASTVLDRLTLALQRFVERAERVRSEQLQDPTPCSDWSVRDLLQHLAYELAWAVPMLNGATLEEVGDRFDTDLLGEDPAGAIAQRARQLQERFQRETSDTVHTTQGEMERDAYLGQLTFDLTVHGWDLAVATGQDDTLERELVDAALLRAERDVPGGRSVGIFDEPPVDPDAQPGAQPRLLALTGRDPAWSPPA